MKRHAILGTALAAALALAACGSDTSSPSSSSGGDDGGGSSGGTLTLGAIGAPATFDPAGSEWGNYAPFYQAVYDTLLLMTPEGEIEPFLATDWSYNDDNTVLTLTLRDDVEFTDGSMLTADVVKENLERFKNGDSPDAGYLAGVDEAVAVDETTVEIRLAAPDPALLNYLTRDPGLVASGEVLDNEDLATDPVGSGPYVLDTGATVTGNSYVYTQNPDYWNPDLQHYDAVTIKVFEDPTAALNAVKAGEANGVKLSTNDNLEEVGAAGWTVHADELNFHGLLLLDRGGTMNEALGDLRVRQALNYAFDREGLLQAIEQGHGTVTTQVFPESSEAFDPALDDRYTYDPQKARDLLAEAGYADNLTLSMPTSAVLGSTTFTLLEQQLADVGVTVEYTDPGNNYIADMLAPKFPLAFMALEQNPDWQLIQFMVGPNAVFNPFKYEDPEVNELMERIQFGDEDEQAAAAGELNAYLVEQAWFAPFYRAQGSFATDPATAVELVPTNAYPTIYDFRPAS
ncbi:ABC transporter substrate-binding protein [Phytoactinopolyspora endophytica]|uniref:ABC transporter substrate-binding protein n=1 Tax=Phytoactinopolyspora endophytica TaxID=1642495 RepID=UPI00101C9631|nr:ABC transporter substrate-binding protein [Phytoactinopolyspora endophytica]